MKSTTPLQGRTALLTGASTGIGAAIADRLAARGLSLVLVARTRTTLEDVAATVRARHGVPVRLVALDLAEPGAPAALLAGLDADGIDVDVLINNAGVAVTGPVAGADAEAQRALIDLNVGALTELTTRVVPAMIARGRGAVVNIASVGGYLTTPTQAAYGASKAYVLSFTRALWAETEHTGVRVVAVSPGPTRTPMNPRGTRTPEQVAETVMRALEGRGPEFTDGAVNVATRIVFGVLLPGRASARLVRRLMSSRNAGSPASV